MSDDELRQRSPQFARLLDGDDADLTRIALEVACDAYPELDPEACLARIDEIAERVRRHLPVDVRPRRVIDRINAVVYGEEGFRGNAEDYYDPRNSYLNEVLDRRLGIPLSLSVLYLAVADRVGLPMAGMNLPGHFMIRTGWGNAALYVDPFHGGELLDLDGCARRVLEITGEEIDLDEELIAPCPTSVVVARMLRNLKVIHLRDGDFEAALPVLRRLVLLSGFDPTERRDLGVAALQAQHSGEAIDHLEAYINERPKADDVRSVAALLKAARRDVASWN
jgi:regulator of sirC expression with transglutaminase-like and TPR domain